MIPSEGDQGPMLLATAFSLYAVTLLVYAARMWTRLHPKFALTAADYTITAAIVSKSISLGFTAAAISLGYGKHAVDIPAGNLSRIGRYTFAVFLAGVPASCFARISIACLLRQFNLTRWGRVALWAVIGLQVSIIITYETVQLVHCKSVISNEVKIKDSQCLTPSQVWAFTYVNVSIAMVSDFICAAIPILLVWGLSRSVVERVLISVLMASCLLATGCGVAKIYYMVVYDFTSKDGLYLMIPEFFWCRMEEAIIIIAACAPLLKSPIERGLRRLGVRTFRIPTRELNVLTSGEISSGKGSGSSLDRHPSRGTQGELEAGRRTT